MIKLQGAKNGFWQLQMDEKSSYLTTFSTPWERFRFPIFPLSLYRAPEEFQKSIDDILKGDEEIKLYFDDIALSSATVEEHCNFVTHTVTKARETNLKFNTKTARSHVS